MSYTLLQYNDYDDNTAMHQGKLEDCTHTKFAMVENSAVRTRESFDDCLHEKFVLVGKFSGAHQEMPKPDVEMKSLKLFEESKNRE